MTLWERYYKTRIAPKVFALGGRNAERGHDWGLSQLQRIQSSRVLTAAARWAFVYYHPMLETQAFGVKFPNPLGLAAGFDKYGRVFHTGVPAFGWASCDIGGICKDEQAGTPHSDDDPRLMRSIKDQALWNQMGFNNPGAHKATAALFCSPRSPIPIGLNIGKSAATPLEQAVQDYCHTARVLWPYVDYLVINVSSPNTKALRQLQAASALTGLVSAVEQVNQALAKDFSRSLLPLGIKIAPDLETDQLEAIVLGCKQCGPGVVNFIEAVNTTTSRAEVPGWNIPEERGGVSGRPLQARAERVLGELFGMIRQERLSIDLVGTGGIHDAVSLFRRILLGASVCRVYTAWVFEGPDFVKRTLRDLVGLLQINGFRNVREAVGRAHNSPRGLSAFGL